MDLHARCFTLFNISYVHEVASLHNHAASLKRQFTFSSGHLFLCSLVSFLFTFSLHLSLGQFSRWSTNISWCSPWTLQRSQHTNRLGHSCLQWCSRSFLRNSIVSHFVQYIPSSLISLISGRALTFFARQWGNFLSFSLLSTFPDKLCKSIVRSTQLELVCSKG